jgi:rhodanese-related sulfurtransferase
MKLNAIGLVILSLVALFCNCQGQAGKQDLNTDTFQKKLAETPDRIILDVRTLNEYNKGRIPESICIDYYGNDFRAKVALLDKNKPVFTYCAAGPRSESASKILADMGFKEVYMLKGGFNAWLKEKKPVER